MDTNEKLVAKKQPYEAPKATFVPLKLEERLLACTKNNGGKPCLNGSNLNS